MTLIKVAEKKILKSFDDLDYDMSPTPEQLTEIYDNGFCGVIQDKPAYYSLRTSVSRFYDAFPQAVGIGKGKVSLPFKAALALEPEFGRYESQLQGDCVSMGTRNAGMIDYCIDALFGETEYNGRFATENIYGARGHRGQGANCATLARYVSQEGVGGFLVRKKYTSKDGKYTADLSRYNPKLGAGWGPMTPTWVNEIAAENKALRVFSVKTIDEARDAIAAGFGLNVCSGYGFSSKRNEDGLSEQKGSWSHGQCWCAVDDTDYAHQKYNGPLFMIQNSWSSWNSGPKKYDQPDGSYFIRPSIASKMLNAGGAWCIASVRGYNRELVYDTMSKVAELSKD